MADHKHTNRLADETSPYLLQHAHNPVDWYPWGREAFEAAKAQNKPIFLSVGYSTCYWCHVMERQCFEVESIADEMNKRFINIKVDREERPDVDSLYMTAVQVLTRHGGWPMSVFLTPDLRPFYGGTYFPPTDAHGRPGFVSVLQGLDDAWQNRKDEVEKSAGQLANILQQVAQPHAAERTLTIDDDFIARVVRDSMTDYDPQYGGFGSAPKFPRETLLELLLDHLFYNPNPKQMAMVAHTLDAMALGGIRDHLGGGFHRYSTDAQWLVPHFEIMLYDNAMLGHAYVEAYRQTERPRYAQIARGVFDFVLREMTSPDGGFYTALDAETDAKEGESYLWTPAEVEEALGSADDARLFNRVYGLDRGPNFADPHGPNPSDPDKNILCLDEFPDDELEDRLALLRAKLKAVRNTRKQPMLDTKIITSWNALMIRALAIAGRTLSEPRYTEAAARGANFLLTHHRTPDGTLLRTSRDGKAKYAGFLDDYAFFAQALMALHESDGRYGWKDAAATIATDMVQKFEDDKNGGFFYTAVDSSELPVRQKVAGDSPLPSGNAMAAMVMQDLGHGATARATIAAFAPQMEQMGEGMSSMILAAAKYVRQEGPIEIGATADVKPTRDNTLTAAAAPPSAVAPAASLQASASDVLSIQPVWVSPTELWLNVTVMDGYHINAHEPLAGLVATQLSVAGGDGATVTQIDYPPSIKQKFEFAPDLLPVYAGEITIALHLSSPPKAPLRLALQYQPCSDIACLAAVTKQLTVAPD
ncbi:MAG TPA: DUF255 domain-containing protein [Tepidisphaeraceae bacterium]|jgi:hypothetical protein|nr:DUF255 domain-containing protein [Tepidisphaeraceae bacterium]